MILDSRAWILLCRHSFVLKPLQCYATQCAMWGWVWFSQDITRDTSTNTWRRKGEREGGRVGEVGKEGMRDEGGWREGVRRRKWGRRREYEGGSDERKEGVRRGKREWGEERGRDFVLMYMLHYTRTHWGKDGHLYQLLDIGDLLGLHEVLPQADWKKKKQNQQLKTSARAHFQSPSSMHSLAKKTPCNCLAKLGKAHSY